MKMKIFVAIIIGFASNAICDSWVFHLKVNAIQFQPSYDGGPARSLSVVVSDVNNVQTTYKYLFEEAGNSLQYGTALMSGLMLAKSLGSEIGIKSKSAPYSDVIVSVQF